MLINLIKIGNSKGIRIPSYIIKECNIKDKIELEIAENTITIRAVENPRADWESGFQKMHKNKDDKLVIDEEIDINAGDWEWK